MLGRAEAARMHTPSTTNPQKQKSDRDANQIVHTNTISTHSIGRHAAPRARDRYQSNASQRQSVTVPLVLLKLITRHPRDR